MSLLLFTDEERALVDDLSQAAVDLWSASKRLEVLNTDPRAVSLMLYSRLWSNHRSFLILWKSEMMLEASIILRSALEASICLAANHVLREDFYKLLLGDLVATLKSQIKRWRENGFQDLVVDGEKQLRALANRVIEKPRAFNWKELADISGQQQLYGYHKQLSMVSSHVTGLSLMRHVGGTDEVDEHFHGQLRELHVPMHIRQMMIALLIGAKFHAAMIETPDSIAMFAALEKRLEKVSNGWVE